MTTFFFDILSKKMTWKLKKRVKRKMWLVFSMWNHVE